MARQIDYTKLNPRKILRIGTEIKPTFNVSELERLHSWLADDTGVLSVLCQFNVLSDNTVLMKIAINGRLNALCKRCLSAFALDWSSASDLRLEAEDTVVEGTFDEPYESIAMTHNGTINLIDIVIDEIILGLPETHQKECVHELGHVF